MITRSLLICQSAGPAVIHGEEKLASVWLKTPDRLCRSREPLTGLSCVTQWIKAINERFLVQTPFQSALKSVWDDVTQYHKSGLIWAPASCRSCKFVVQDLTGVCKKCFDLGMPLKQEEELLHSSVSTLKKKVSIFVFLKVKPLPDIVPQAKRGIDRQGFQFQTPQGCQHHSRNRQLLTT